MDISVEASETAENTYLAARRGAWIIPKYLFGKPLDTLATNPRVPMTIGGRMLEKIITLHVGRPEKFGLPKPDHASARRTRRSPGASTTASSTARSRPGRTSPGCTPTRSSSPTGHACTPTW
jgi:hypothetical protein